MKIKDKDDSRIMIEDREQLFAVLKTARERKFSSIDDAKEYIEPLKDYFLFEKYEDFINNGLTFNGIALKFN